MEEQVEAILKANLGENMSRAHGFGHLQRSAEWAFWFVTNMEGTLHEAELAYVAGLFHDVVRPTTDKIWHSETSAKKARALLSGFYNDKDIEKICRAIANHCEPKEEWDSFLEQAPFFADKVAEGAGAYVCLRHALWTGESEDYDGQELKQVFPFELREKVGKRLRPGYYPSKFSKLVEYQARWPTEFAEAVEKEERDAILLMELFNRRGKEKMDMEKAFQEAMLHKFGNFGTKFIMEAMHYIRGGKQSSFEQLIVR